MPYRNIVDDISHYFIQSEQTQTYIEINFGFGNHNGVLFSNAIYAELLPGATLDLIHEVEQTGITHREFFTSLNKYSKNNIEEKLSELFQDVKVIGYSPVQFFCGCSKEMFYGMLHSDLGNDRFAVTEIKTARLASGVNLAQPGDHGGEKLFLFG